MAEASAMKSNVGKVSIEFAVYVCEEGVQVVTNFNLSLG